MFVLARDQNPLAGRRSPDRSGVRWQPSGSHVVVDGTIEEDLGSYGTQYRLNSGGNLDKPLTAEDGTLHVQIDLSDRTGWWLTGWW